MNCESKYLSVNEQLRSDGDSTSESGDNREDFSDSGNDKTFKGQYSFFKIIFISSFQEVKIEEEETEADKEDLTRCTPVDEVKEISSDNEKTEETDKTEDDDASVASSNFRPVTAPAGTMESQRVEQKNEK